MESIPKMLEHWLTTVVVCFIAYLTYRVWKYYAEQDATRAAAEAAAEADRIAREELARRNDPLRMIGKIASFASIGASIYRATYCEPTNPVPPQVDALVNGINKFAKGVQDINDERADFDARYGNGNLAPTLANLDRRYRH
jgi:hypothetical protein